MMLIRSQDKSALVNMANVQCLQIKAAHFEYGEGWRIHALLSGDSITLGGYLKIGTIRKVMNEIEECYKRSFVENECIILEIPVIKEEIDAN